MGEHTRDMRLSLSFPYQECLSQISDPGRSFHHKSDAEFLIFTWCITHFGPGRNHWYVFRTNTILAKTPMKRWTSVLSTIQPSEMILGIISMYRKFGEEESSGPVFPRCPVVFHLTWGMISSRKDSKKRISSQALSSRTKNPHQYTFCACICHSEIQKTLVVKLQMYHLYIILISKVVIWFKFWQNLCCKVPISDWTFQVFKIFKSVFKILQLKLLHVR